MQRTTRRLAGLAALVLLVFASAAGARGAETASAGKIAFHRSSGTGVADVYVVDPDGTGLRRLTTTRNNFAPAWSPDGRRIVFASDRAGGSGAPELYVMDANGRNVTRITRSVRTRTQWQSNYDPAWSGDGTRIVFVRLSYRGNRDVADLYTVAPDGTGLRQLTRTPAPEGSPSWSPDGRSIAFERNGGVWIMNADGTGARRIVAVGSHPSFSPDGTRIAFSDVRGWVATIGSDGRLRRNLVRGNGAPAWSADGTEIVYQGVDGLRVVGADGSGRRRLTRPPSLRHDLEPSWQPAAAPQQ